MVIFRYFVLLFLLASHSAFATLELENASENKVKLSTLALQYHAEIQAIKAAPFLNEKKKSKADQLLANTLDNQEKQIRLLSDSLADYRKKNKSEAAWEVVQINYDSALSIGQDKAFLIKKSTPKISYLVTGFGPEGVTQFKQELHLAKLSLSYFLHQEMRVIKLFINDIKISPIPVLFVFFKMFLVFLGLRYWLKISKNLLDSLHKKMIRNPKKRGFLKGILWYFGKTNGSISWLVAVLLALSILASLPVLESLIFLHIFILWIFGGLITMQIVLEFLYQHSRRLSKEATRLQLSTVRLYLFLIIFSGVTKDLAIRSLGQGTIYAWINSAIFYLFLLLTFYILKTWRTIIFENLDKREYQPDFIVWCIIQKDKFLLSTVATVVAGVWLVWQLSLQKVVEWLADYQLFSHALAYVFRVEVAKQAKNDHEMDNLEALHGEETFNYILPGSENIALVKEYAQKEMDALCTYLYADKPALCVLAGERGTGTTTFLRRILHHVENASPLYIDCPSDGYFPLLENLAQQFNVQYDEGDNDQLESNVLDALRNTSESYLIAFDSIQRLVKPRVGGLAHLIRLTNLLREVRTNHRFIIAIDKSSWRFVDRARGDRLLFDLLAFMPRWTETEIHKMLDTRISETGEFAISFAGLALPRQWGGEELSESERAKNGFYRILWDYSDGNSTVALRFFRRSLFRNKETNQVEIRIFVIPSSEGLEKMPKPMLAVLRSIVQLETASPEELMNCTQLSLSEVIGTLRFFQSRGYIEWEGNTTRISDLWYRNITNILDRQHLLVK